MAERERSDTEGTDVVLMVCVKCGKEAQFEDGDVPPSDMKCEKCGGEVFRRFDDNTEPGEAAQDFRETTERDTSTTDSAEDTTEQDLLDLNNP